MKIVDHNRAAKRIILALKGPVAEVFRDLIPTLRELDGPTFYDSALDRSDLLHACLMVFRKRRDAFVHLLVDEQGREVSDDFVALRCGRSVHDIISMVVRSHAKRHFRTMLGHDHRRDGGAGDDLYAAMRDYLIHDWQVALIPHYAPMPLAHAKRIGPALLDLTSVDLVNAEVTKGGGQPYLNGKAKLITLPPEVSPVATIAATVAAEEPILVENHSQEADFWWETLNDPQVRTALGNLADRDLRELTAAFCGLNEATRTQMLGPLGLSLFQAGVLLTRAYQGLGRAPFHMIFGQPGNPAAITELTNRLRLKGVGSRSDLRSIARVVDSSIQSLPRAAGPRPGSAAAGKPVSPGKSSPPGKPMAKNAGKTQPAPRRG